MEAKELLNILEDVSPAEVASTLWEALFQVLSDVDDEARRELLMSLAGEPGHDKVSSMVHL